MLIEFSAISSDIKWFISKFEFNLDIIMQLTELEQLWYSNLEKMEKLSKILFKKN